MLEVLISKPRIVTNESSARLEANIEFISEKLKGSKLLYFEVKKEFGDYFCYEKCDAFVIALLLFLMEKSKSYEGVTLKSDAPMSERLWFALTTWWIPTVVNNTERYDQITIDIPLDNEVLESANAVATGISGGVDSTYTVARYSKAPGRFKLNYGIFLNWRNSNKDEAGWHCDELERNIAKEVCKNAGLNFLEVKSNITRDLYSEAHAAVITAVFSSYIMSLQKLVSRYYFSSTCPASMFEFTEHDMEHFDLFTLPCLATENVEFFSAGSEVSRFEKVDYISNIEWVKSTLTVCGHWAKDDHQCSQCSKCTRTMCELDILGKLEDFNKRFDINSFRNNPSFHYGYVLMLRKKNIFCKEIYEEMKRRGIRIPLKYWVAAFKKYCKHGFHAENPHAKGYRTRKLEDVLNLSNNSLSE